MSSLQDLAKAAGEELATLVDRLRVQAHLGGQEAQQTLEQLQPQIERVRAWLATASGEAELQARLAAMDAGSIWRDLKPRVWEIAQRVKDKAAPLADEAKLQAHLAAMEAKAAVSESTLEEAKQALEEVKKELREIRDTLRGE